MLPFRVTSNVPPVPAPTVAVVSPVYCAEVSKYLASYQVVDVGNVRLAFEFVGAVNVTLGSII